MSAQTHKATVRRMIEQVWNARRLELIEEFFSEEIIGHIPGVPVNPGLEGLRETTAQSLQAFPDLKLAIEDEIAEGDKVVLRWTSTGTHKGELYGIPATGKQITQSGMSIYRMANAKIAELWFLADSMGLMQQLGVIPTLGEA